MGLYNFIIFLLNFIILVESNYDALRKMGLFGDRGVPPHPISRWGEQEDYDPSTQVMLDDMLISKYDHQRLFEPGPRRNAIIDGTRLWPNKTLVYYMDEEYDDEAREIVRSGIKMIENVTCIKFIELYDPRQYRGTYVHITPENGCYASVGYCTNRACKMSLQIPSCLRKGIVAHEFLHSLGFYHMQCASGRNHYINIKWDNIIPQMHSNFREYADDSTLLGTPYDYDSITHYGQYFFSINGESTIETRDRRSQSFIGQRDHLSHGDIIRIRKLYQCDEVDNFEDEIY